MIVLIVVYAQGSNVAIYIICLKMALILDRVELETFYLCHPYYYFPIPRKLSTTQYEFVHTIFELPHSAPETQQIQIFWQIV